MMTHGSGCNARTLPLVGLSPHTGSDGPLCGSALFKLQAWSSTGNSQVMIQKLLEDKFVLEEIAILGNQANLSDSKRLSNYQ